MENEYGLEHIHRKLLDSLIALDNICRENGICYTLHGGTLLGAERNHKFIPWDDDVDVAMTRTEYRKFKQAVSNEKEKVSLFENVLWCSRFVYQTDDDPVFIDIMIYDYITESRIGSLLKINTLRLLQGMIKRKENLVFHGRSIIYKILIGFTYLLGRLFPLSAKIRVYHYIEEKVLTGNHTKIHRSNDSFYGLPFIFDKDFMSEYSEIVFEGRSFMVNKRYKEFLRRNYGDNYLVPPPEKERNTSHNTIRKRIKKSY